MYEKLLKEKQEQKNQEQGQNSNQKSKENQGSGASSGQKSKENNREASEKKNDQDEQNQNDNGQNSNENQDSNSNKNQNNKSKNNDVGHDTHSLWDKAIEEQEKSEKQNKSKKKKGKSKKESKKNKKKEQGDKSEQNSKETEKEEKIKENIEKASQMGEKEAFDKNKEQRKKQLEQLKNELAKRTVMAGKTTNSEQRKVNNIGQAKPIIDWRRLLKEAIKYDVDWSYQNATIENGVITPHLEEMPMPETEIVLDTSGSVDENLLRNFLRECKNIIKTSKVKVGCFDTKFYGFQEIRREKDIDTLRFQGGGGTDFNAAVNAFSRRVENKIIFTDGMADMPDKSIDAIWIVFGYRNIKPKGGKVINITEEQLRKLYRNNDLYR